MFITDYNIKYKMYFSEYGHRFRDPVMARCVYLFNIVVEEGKPGENGVDLRVADTVFAVLRRFFEEQTKALIYICDSSDSRELARKRKFDIWFNKYHNNAFVKGEYAAIFGEEKVYNSMILSKDNPLWYYFLVACDRLNKALSKPDGK